MRAEATTTAASERRGRSDDSVGAESPGRAGVIDLGRRSTRMLVAELRDGHLEELERRWLGSGRADGDDGLRALDDCEQSIEARGCTLRRLVLTGAAEAGSDDGVLAAELERRYRAPAVVLDLFEERQLTFQGATHGVPLEQPTMFLDIGGGSTNVMIAHHGRVAFGAVIRLGVRRQTQELLKHDPPDPHELETLKREAEWQIGLAQPDGPIPDCEQAIAVLDAPSWTDSAVRMHRLKPSGHSGFTLTRETCEWAIDELAGLSASQRETIPGLDRGRAGTILAGAVILLATMRRFRLQSVLVSRRDLLDGLALELTKDQA